MFVKLEKLRRHPCFNAVIGNIYRHVPNDFHAFVIGVFFQITPLSEKFILNKFKKFCFFFKFLGSFFQCITVSHCQFFVPFIPRFTVIFEFESHKQCIIIKPRAVFFNKSFVPFGNVSFICFISLS